MKYRLSVALLVFCLLAVSPALALRVYLIGNSVTDVVNYDGLAAQATAKGFTHVWNRHMIPGAPLEWLWDHRTEGFCEQPYGYPEACLANYDWDALTLQPFDRMLDSDTLNGGQYMTRAHARNANVQVYIYSRWPRTPGDVAPTDASLTAATWDQLWLRHYTGGWDGTNESKNYFDTLTTTLRRMYTTYRPILEIPAGDVLHELNVRAQAGHFSAFSIDEAWDFYSDGIHFNNIGSYVVGCTFFATIYKTDPRGMAVPAQYGSITRALADTIQSVVWGVVSTYPLAGVGSTAVIDCGKYLTCRNASLPAEQVGTGRAVYSLTGRLGVASASGSSAGMFVVKQRMGSQPVYRLMMQR
jgi:hypothetical protein